ncbi:MAG: arginase [Bacteriovorax sp.]|nr:arginase [Bacteriovorax sp.]
MRTLINFLGMSFEVGQYKSGLDQSTKACRQFFHYLKDQGIDFVDHGDIQNPNIDQKVKIYSDSDLQSIEWSRYEAAYIKAREILSTPYPLLNWGGDHSIALATAGAFTSKNPEGYVIWIDAHADLNLPEHSMSGNLHGMPLAVLLNLNGIRTKYFKWLECSLNPAKLIYVGLRDVDLFEKNAIESLGIKTFQYKDIQKSGMKAVAEEILVMTSGNPVHVSFDIDSVDPRFAPSTGVPVKSGLTPNDLNILGEELLKKSNVRSLDIVEVNPELGTSSQVERTFLIAFNLLKSVFNNNYPGDNYDGISERDSREQFTQI